MSRRVLIPLVLAALTVPLAMAQDNPAPQQQQQQQSDRGRDRGPGGGREGYMTRIKEQMGITSDEEWKVIEAKLQPVMTKRMEGMAGMFGGSRGGRGGDQNADSNRQRGAVEQASRDLRTLLEDKAAPEDQIKVKLAAFREAREKSRTELVSLQKELKEILMPRQEAVLVTMGMLE